MFGKNKNKVAINGFGRIGRLLFKMSLEDKDVNVVAINDLGDIDNLVYLLKYDTAQESIKSNIEIETISENEKYLIIENNKIRVFSERDPKDLPWEELEINVAAECTGVFNSYDKANFHIEAGAKKVVISGPVKEGQDYSVNENVTGSTVLMGLNEDKIKTCSITSNASCTTNAVALPLDVLRREIGVKSAILTTIHSYTASQSLVDSPVKSGKKDFRKGRSAALNMIPTSTGSAKAVGKVIEEFDGKFDGVSVRVPTVAGSLVDVTLITEKETSIKEINEILKNASLEDKYKDLLNTTEDQIVSSDIIGNKNAAIVDLSFTRVVDGNLVKIFV